MTLPVDPSIAINKTNVVAFIIDGQVVEIDNTGAYYAAVLTNNEITVMDITSLENADDIEIGYTYDPIAKTFTPPVI